MTAILKRAPQEFRVDKTFGSSPIEDIYECAIIGISPFNSYFSETKIHQLINWAKENFKDYYLFVPDEPSKFTLMALGYDEARATKKMKKQKNWYNNKIKRVINEIENSDKAFENKVLNWKKLSSNQRYNIVHQSYHELFKNDHFFATECLSATKWVLNNKGITDQKALHLGVNYFISELPLFFNANLVVGKKATTFVYSSAPELVKNTYIMDQFNILSPFQSFMTITDLESEI